VERAPHPALSPQERGEGDERAGRGRRKTLLRVLAAGSARAVAKITLGNNRGRRECRVRAAPMAACASVVSTRVSNQGHTAINRHSLRDGFNGLYRALPGDRALLPPSFARSSRDLGVSVGTPGPHVLAVREQTHSSGESPRPSHPASNVRDDRDTPLLRRRDAREHACDLPDAASAFHCDTLARRAICACLACENCPSCKITSRIAPSTHGEQSTRQNTSYPRKRVSSTPRSLDLIADVSGILDHPDSRVMTTESRIG
jgi:hypothetical protein